MRCSKVAMIGHCSFLCTGVFYLAALKECGPLEHRTDNYGLVRMPAAGIVFGCGEPQGFRSAGEES
jgi:hypothetical protein